MKKILKILICSILLFTLILSVVACRENIDTQNTDTFHLTVHDPYGYLKENLQRSYKAGENVTVKIDVLTDVDIIAFLDDVSLGKPTTVRKDDEYQWEFYFVMPAHDAVLNFQLSDGMGINFNLVN